MPSEWNAVLATVRTLVRRTGPYLALELVLPGGTLLALLLFLWQRRAAVGGTPRDASWQALKARVRPAWQRLRVRTRRMLPGSADATAVQ